MRTLHIEDLDALDRSIIALLQEQGRRTNANIARATGVHESTVKKRIDRLIDSGVLRVLAVLDPDAAGYSTDVILGISVRPESLQAVGEKLSQLNPVAWVGYISGRYDILIEVVHRDHNSLFDFLAAEVATIDGILGYETFFIMRKPKIDYQWKLPPEFLEPLAGVEEPVDAATAKE
jgi:Lrp/AsnC family transcriptional regulator, regulator for asnA, asnC and gidA